MKTTRVIHFHQTGGPDVLAVDEIPIGEPEGDEVRVRVQAMALNRADLLWRAGTYVEEPILPSRIGYDVAGVVEATGPKVANLKIGDRVSSFPAASVQRYGSHGETALYPESCRHESILDEQCSEKIGTIELYSARVLFDLSEPRPHKHAAQSVPLCGFTTTSSSARRTASKIRMRAGSSSATPTCPWSGSITMILPPGRVTRSISAKAASGCSRC
jgi:NADPH:quinone reductase-like Zn-dependent oxidoreductase